MKKLFIGLFIFAVIVILIISFSIKSTYAQTSNLIEIKMSSIMSEIDELVQHNSYLAMSSNPHDYINNSKNYNDIIAVGTKAVKPLYDMLYSSRNAGLYEYILALAIEDITDQQYIYNVEYGWKNALEFRLCYEMKVNNSFTQFERIMNTVELTDDEKIQNITEIGIFAIGCLLDEYDKSNSLLSKFIIEKSLVNIINISTDGMNNFNIGDLSNWRVENESAYRSLMELQDNSYIN